ncbi:CopG family transcriptional regulator [Halotia wernerae UHCC 0503]|nr:CopG family transcriptional regulator [Halotia wernerae UHCC 0503]
MTLAKQHTENKPTTRFNKKWAVKRITINLASTEVKELENYCSRTGRPATDVIRELIRSLSTTKY